MAKQATDTFSIQMPDGSERLVAKGEVLSDSHPVVRQAGGLFRDLDLDEGKAARATAARRKAR